MNKLKPMEWVAAVVVSLLATICLSSLATTYFLFLPVPSGFGVSAEDRWALEQSSIIATHAFFNALTCGFFLGIILPVTYTWIKGRRSGLAGGSEAEPGAAPNGGLGTAPGDSGVTEGPPSVS